MDGVDAKLRESNGGVGLVWVPVHGIYREDLKCPWVYYRPLGFSVVLPGTHDLIASVLLGHWTKKDWGYYGKAQDELLDCAPYAFNSGASQMGLMIPPLFRRGNLHLEEIDALSQFLGLMDIDDYHGR